MGVRLRRDKVVFCLLSIVRYKQQYEAFPGMDSPGEMQWSAALSLRESTSEEIGAAQDSTPLVHPTAEADSAARGPPQYSLLGKQTR